MHLEVCIEESEVREAVTTYIRGRMGRNWTVGQVNLSVGSDGKVTASGHARPDESGGKD